LIGFIVVHNLAVALVGLSQCTAGLTLSAGNCLNFSGNP